MVHDDCMRVRARVSHEEEEEEVVVVGGGGGRCSTTPYRFPLLEFSCSMFFPHSFWVSADVTFCALRVRRTLY